MLSKFNLIKLIDLISLLGLLLLVSTGTLLKFILPPKSGSASVLGLTRHDWGEVHFILAALFIWVLVVHFLLHAAFIKSAVLELVAGGRKRLMMLLLALVVFVSLVLAPLIAPVENKKIRPGVSGGYLSTPQVVV